MLLLFYVMYEGYEYLLVKILLILIILLYDRLNDICMIFLHVVLNYRIIYLFYLIVNMVMNGFVVVLLILEVIGNYFVIIS